MENGQKKDTPWDAVLMGSVACTVNAKVKILFEFSKK